MQVEALQGLLLLVNRQLHMTERNTYKRLLAILAVAILPRLIVAVFLGDTIDRTIDEFSYSALATRVAAGHGFSFGEDWYPFTAAGQPTAHWSFLYTALVAAAYLVAGYHPLIVRLAQGALGGVLLPWLIYRLSRRLFPGRPLVALTAAACAAVYAYFILYAAQLMTETFYIAALLWSLERALALAGDEEQEAWSWKTTIVLGVSLAIAALLRQSVLPWVAVLFVWLLVRAFENAGRRLSRWRRMGAVVVAGLFVLLSILPFTVRNFRAYGAFLMLNSNAGYAMYSAQHPLHGTDFQAFTAAPLPVDLLDQELNEAQWDRALMERGIGFVVADPVRYLRLSASRVLDYFEFWPTDTTILHNVGRLLSFTLFLPLFVVGTVLGLRYAWRESGDPCKFWQQPVTLLVMFAIFYSALHIFTWAMPRYRLPVDAAMMPLAALALLEARWLLHKHILAKMVSRRRVTLSGRHKSRMESTQE